MKLDRSAIVDLYGSEGALEQLPRGTYVRQGGVDPGEAASLFGYRSGDEMLRDLMALEDTRRQAREQTGKPHLDLLQHLVDQETDRRMLERYGDALSDGSIEAEALAAVHSDRQAAVLAIELRALARQVGAHPLSVDVIRSWASGLLSDQPIRRGIDWRRYARDEAKTGRQVERALLRGNIVEAFQAKQRQVLAHILTGLSRETSERYDAGMALVRRYASRPTIDSMDQSYLDRIHDLLQRFGVAIKRDPDELDRALDGRSLESFLAAKIDEGREIVMPSFLLDERFRRSRDELTVDQHEGLIEAIRSLAHNGRDERTATVDGQRIELHDLWREAREQFDELKARPAGRRYDPTLADRLKSGLRTMDASLLKNEQVLDWADRDDPNGVFNRVVMRPLKEAQGREYDMRRETAERLRMLKDSLGKGWNKALDRQLPDQPELVDPETGAPMGLTRKNLLAIALNTGNADSFSKLADGYGWSQDGVRAVLARNMTKADWDFVQGVWDTFEHYWPDIEAMQRRLAGVPPDKVEAVPVETEFGSYRGGYYPLVYDPLRGETRPQYRSPAGDLFESSYQRATTPKGHTISRTDGTGAPVWLSLDIIPWKLNQAIHDLAFREAIMAADRFLNGAAVREGFARTVGMVYYRQLRPWLKSIANGVNIDGKSLAFWDRFLHQARSNFIMVGIGYRLSTMLKHGTTALSNSVGELGPHWLRVGAVEFFGTPEKMQRATDFVFSRSTEMRHRMNAVDRDVRETLDDLTGDRSPVGAIVRFGHYGVSMLDMASAMPTWLGAYRKALSQDMSETDAAYAADKAVRKAHGAQSAIDLAAVQRGTEAFKLLTMFYGFFNHIYNRERDTVRLAGRALDQANGGNWGDARRDFAMVLARSFYYVVAPALIEELTTSGPPSGDEGWGQWLLKALGGELPAGLPVMRDIAKAAINGREYEMSPMAKAVSTAIGTTKDFESAAGLRDRPASPRWLQHAMETAGYAFGLPTGQAGASAQYLWDLSTGKTHPQSAGELVHGIVFGPAPARQH